ncbi:MAG: VPS10 domain-containing protein [Aureliella sp.]
MLTQLCFPPRFVSIVESQTIRLTILNVALTLCLLSAGALSGQESVQPSLPDAAVENFEWRSIGPANMGGRITSIAVYEKDSNIWWAASASGGLLKTVNNGVSFEHQFDDQATVSIGDVQVAQSDPKIVWVGTGESNPRNSSSWGDGVYKSVDGGETWKNMGLKKIFQTGRIAIHPTDPNIVYVGALGRLWGPNEDRGLYKTTDGGESWEKILYVDDKTGVIDVQMNMENPDTLLVATYERKRDGFDGNDPEVKFGAGAGIYRTTDGGKNFTRVTEGLPAANMGRIGLSIYRKDPQHVYAVVESEKIGQAPEDFPYVGFTGSSADVGARINSVSPKTAAAKAELQEGDIVVAVDDSRVLSYEDLQKAIRSKKAGDSAKWEIVRDGEAKQVELTYEKREAPSEEQRERESRMRRNSRSPFSASLGGQVANLQGQQGENEQDYGGVYHSDDGGVTWKRINTVNPRPMYYSQIRVDPSDQNNIYVLGTSLYRSKDGGEEFTSDGAGGEVHVDHHSLWVDPNDGRHMILGNDGGIYVTYDRMESWDHHNHVAICQFYHVGLSADEDYHVYGGLQDNGSWGGPTRVADNDGPMNSDWFRVGSGDGFICLVDPTDPNQIYFESQNGAMGRIHLKTGERGFIRPRAPRGTRYRFNWKTPFILSPHNPSIHYSAGNHVFKSVSKGDRVSAISPEITNTDKGSGSAIAESPRIPGVVYAGTTDGALWMTKDDGKSWINLFDEESLKQFNESEEEQTTASVSVGASGPRGGQRGRRGQGGGRPSPERLIEMIMSQDKNKDGVVDKSEISGRMRAAFGRFDKNEDGEITREELTGDQPTKETSADEKQSDDPAATAEGSDDEARETGPDQEESASAESFADDASKSKDDPEADAKTAVATPGPSDDNDEIKSEGSAREDAVSGVYSGKFVSENMPADEGFTLTLRLQPENKLKGSFESSRSSGDIEGTFDPEASTMKFYASTGQAELEFSGTLADGRINGSIDINGGSFSIDFEAKRTGDASAQEDSDSETKSDGSVALAELVPDPRWVSSITASRFEDGRCYISLDGHRSNDDEPYIFVTENFGKTWRSIRGNLPTSAGSTRVLREDIENENVLYLGCEFSIWVSIDRGESWTKLNSNLPTVAVHEIAQHPTRGEIVAGTHGRALWIMDATGLRQLSKESLDAAATLYAPNTVIRWRSTVQRGSAGTRDFVGENPSSSADIFYSLGRNARSAKLTISNLLGEEVYETEVETGSGLHKVNWDLRRPSSRGGRGRSPTVATGQYLVTLQVDGQLYRETLDVESDPSFGSAATSEEEVEFWEAMLGLNSEEGADSDSDADSEQDL